MPIYMKVDGVTGTGTGKYFGWIVLESVMRYNLRGPDELIVTKRYDITSVVLYRKSTEDLEMGKVIVHFVKGDAKNPVPSVIWELEGAWLSCYEVAGGGATPRWKN